MAEAQTLTLADFLLARIAEDEDDPIGWHRVECNTVATAAVIRIKGWTGASYSLECDCGGIARQQAEREAKRRIMDLHRRHEGYADPITFCMECGGAPSSGFADWPCDTLRLLALPYSDHPDYSAEWRVG